MAAWTEVGERVLVRRYRFFDQNISAILTDAGPVIVDTRSTLVQADEILADLLAVDRRAPAAVVNTHGHYDHVFGNARFRPAPIWAHERCRTMVIETGERQRATVASEIPPLADEVAAVAIDPPDRTFADRAILDIGGRQLELVHLGRGHTDNDIVVLVPDADVLLAGDLLENDAVPYFGDGYPMDWPDTAAALRDLAGARTRIVPGHGSVGDRTFAERQQREFVAIASLARRVHEGALDMDAALEQAPWPADQARAPIDRALAQLRGELGP